MGKPSESVTKRQSVVATVRDPPTHTRGGSLGDGKLDVVGMGGSLPTLRSTMRVLVHPARRRDAASAIPRARRACTRPLFDREASAGSLGAMNASPKSSSVLVA